MQKSRENALYFFIILLCVVGIIYVSVLVFKTPRQKEAFTELYLKFEKCSKDGPCFTKIEFEKNRVLVDINNNGVFDNDEVFKKGDTFSFRNRYWNIVDVSETQILFGKYPKEIERGEFNFTFVIINHLGKAHEYNYTIKYNELVVSSEKISIENEEKIEIDATILASEIGEAKISIILDTGEEVHFWLRVL
jgi:uncharacterized membrane protein